MSKSSEARISLRPARTGRHRSMDKAFQPDELVRVEVRMPAVVAARLYDRAAHTRQPVGATAAHLLDLALEATGGDFED